MDVKTSGGGGLGRRGEDETRCRRLASEVHRVVGKHEESLPARRAGLKKVGRMRGGREQACRLGGQRTSFSQTSAASRLLLAPTDCTAVSRPQGTHDSLAHCKVKVSGIGVVSFFSLPETFEQFPLRLLRAWTRQSTRCPLFECGLLRLGSPAGPASSHTGGSLSTAAPVVPGLPRPVMAAMATRAMTYRAASHAGVLCRAYGTA